jgi:hypothetical protein
VSRVRFTARALIASGESGSQKFARRFVAEGYAAFIVRSFARGAARGALNLVVGRWGPAPPTKLAVILSGDPGQ